MRLKKIIDTDTFEQYQLNYKGKEYIIDRSDSMYHSDKYHIYLKIGYKTYDAIGIKDSITKSNLKKYLGEL